MFANASSSQPSEERVILLPPLEPFIISKTLHPLFLCCCCTQ
jgi:hypothetical protein